MSIDQCTRTLNQIDREIVNLEKNYLMNLKMKLKEPNGNSNRFTKVIKLK